MNHKILFGLWLIPAAMVFFSCEKEPLPDLVYSAGSNEAVNQWMLDSLRRYYLWNASLPANPDLSPDPQAFFRSMLHKDDRFSVMYNPDDASTLTPSLRMRYGFEIIVFETNGETVAAVTLVLNQSPASRAGLKRGDVLTRLNGKPLTANNAATLLSAFAAGNSGTVTRAVFSGGMWTEEAPLDIGMMYTFEQQDKHTVLNINGKKTGYYFIFSFNETGTYSLLQVFSEFQRAGVHEVVIDLRYNYGGKVSSAAALCALLVPQIHAGAPFIVYKGNANGGTIRQSFAQAIAAEEPEADFNLLMEKSLNLQRVFVLTSGTTASAAELILNNLKPYMEVVQIGETTLGKDVASFEIQDRRNPPETAWVMHPVIYKLFNAEGEGDYTDGISPLPENNLSELAGFPGQPLYELGDPRETLLSHALALLHGD